MKIVLSIFLLVGLAGVVRGEESPERPNFLWISAEDLSPDLGCYGDTYAHTPHLDRLASNGVRFTRAFAHAGVCAPARSGIITGMYPTTIGTHHMRCQGNLPPEVKCFTEYLRAAGYYCTNNSKQDYQFQAPKAAWDESSRKAHWRNRQPGQPFFAVINFTSTHESQIRNDKSAGTKLPDKLKHDPARATLPPYYPDTPVVRRDWANYADNVTAMDRQVQRVLDELKADGLADNTIVWFWGDHGRGLPRAKRWLYDSGLHVPLIIHVPEKWRKHALPSNPAALAPGSVNEQLVSFIDFAPTMLSLAGVPIPEHLPGEPFLGPKVGEPRKYIFAHRDRMDERYDLIRAVRDERFKYIRNYLPQVTRGQELDYMELMPTMREMRRLFAAGQLSGPQLQFFHPTKPVEELYDTAADPHEVRNLADDPQYREVLERLRGVHQTWIEETGDVGFIPEAEFDRLKQSPGWRAELSQSEVLPQLRRLKQLDGKAEAALPEYLAAAKSPHAPLRYWGLVEMHAGCKRAEAIDQARTTAVKLLADRSPAVRVAAAHALCDWGDASQGLPVLQAVLAEGEPNERLLAALALDQLCATHDAALAALEQAQQDEYGYVQRVATRATARAAARE